MLDASHYERIVIDRYRYRGFHDCESHCSLEILRSPSRPTIVIATEMEDNSGMSVTNVCEHLASRVCVDFKIDPSSLVWIEHYGYPNPINSKRPRTYDLVTFTILQAGHNVLFAYPRWRPMTQNDWHKLGIPVRE